MSVHLRWWGHAACGIGFRIAKPNLLLVDDTKAVTCLLCRSTLRFRITRAKENADA